MITFLGICLKILFFENADQFHRKGNLSRNGDRYFMINTFSKVKPSMSTYHDLKTNLLCQKKSCLKKKKKKL